MSIGNVNPDFPVGTNMDQFDVGLIALGTLSLETSTSFVVTIGQEEVAFGGSNLTFDSQGLLTGGSIIAIQDEFQGVVEFNLSGFSIPATSLATWAADDNNAALNNALFSGADTLTGGPQNDLLHGYGGGDSLSGGAGNDTLIGGPGHETLNGGPGTDVITTGGGTDLIIVGLHESGVTQATADTITDWSSGDVLSFAHGPTGANDIAEITASDFTTAAATAANLFSQGSVHILVAAVGSDVVVFADSGNDNAVDDAVILQGATLGEVSINNFTLSATSGSPTSPAPAPVSPPPPVGPPAPTGLALDAAADSGVKGDGITNVAKVVVDGFATPGVTVTLLDGSTPVGAATANATTGAFAVTATSALADGVHTLNVEASDAAGNLGPSASLSVTVDTTPPVAPSGLALDPSADSGTKGDGVTDVAKVVIDGFAEQGATVTLFDGSTPVGTAIANATTGSFSIVSSSALADGLHTLNVEATDVAGNIGPASSINVVIDTHPIGASITGLTQTTSGSKTTVAITGSEADATSTVGIFEDGVSIGSVKPTNGVWSFTKTNVTNAIHTFTTQTTDAAGDVAPGATTLIVGSSGSDKIIAGAGNIIIDGGGGVDTLTAGSGSDVFVYNALSNAPLQKNAGSLIATINNFQDATDKLDLTHLGALTFQGQTTAVSAHGVSWHISNGNTFVVGDADSTGRADFTIELTGVHTLTAADFVLG